MDEVKGTSMAETMVTGRHHGVAEGTTTRTERMVRTFYPDGTQVDSEPVQVAQGSSLSWAGMAGLFSRVAEPHGTRHVRYQRTVTIVAEPWAEIVADDPQHGAA